MVCVIPQIQVFRLHYFTHFPFSFTKFFRREFCRNIYNCGYNQKELPRLQRRFQILPRSFAYMYSATVSVEPALPGFCGLPQAYNFVCHAGGSSAALPTILPMDKIQPVTIPSIDDGKTTVRIMCHLPEPNASAPSRSPSGTVFKLSWVVRITVGRVITTSVSALAIRLVPSEKTEQKQAFPQDRILLAVCRRGFLLQALLPIPLFFAYSFSIPPRLYQSVKR